jgi:hypothetical protein
MNRLRTLMIAVAGLAGVGAAYFAGTQSRGPAAEPAPVVAAPSSTTAEKIDGFVIPAGLTATPGDVPEIKDPADVLLGNKPVPPTALNMPPSPKQPDLIVPDLTKK